MFSKKFKIFFIIALLIVLKSESKGDNPTCEYDGLNIDLSATGLRRIGSNFLSSPLVNCLNLENNEIWKIEDQVFEKLPNLFYLNLAGNWLPYNDFIYNFSTVETMVLDNAFVSTSNSEFHSRYDSECPSCYKKRDHQNYKSNGLRLSVFSNLRNLKTLYLRNNKLVTLLWSQGAPNITHLHLEGNQIDPNDLASYIPPSLTHLYLSNNSINQFERSSVLSHLKELILDNNNLNVLCSNYNCGQRNKMSHYSARRAIPDYPVFVNSSRYMDLGGATELIKLSLSNNKVKQIYPSALEDLVSLQYLDLSDNFIEEIATEVFTNLSSLNLLILRNNHLADIPNFTDLKNLETLMLNENGIDVIKSTSLLNIPKLKYLNLADNDLNQIDSGSFDTLMSLTELNLSGNKLLSLPDNWISSGSAISRLNLGRNLFSDVERMSLSNFTRIEYLDIAENPFEMLSVKSLRNLPENTVINVKQIHSRNASLRNDDVSLNKS